MSSENTHRGEGGIQVCEFVLYLVCEDMVEDNEIISALNVVIMHGNQDQQIRAREIINELQPVE